MNAQEMAKFIAEALAHAEAQGKATPKKSTREHKNAGTNWRESVTPEPKQTKSGKPQKWFTTATPETVARDTGWQAEANGAEVSIGKFGAAYVRLHASVHSHAEYAKALTTVLPKLMAISCDTHAQAIDAAIAYEGKIDGTFRVVKTREGKWVIVLQ